MVFQKIKHIGAQKLSFLAGLAIALSILGTGLAGSGMVSAASNCGGSGTSNDILFCGFSSPSAFISKTKANNNGVNSNHDLQAIYAHYGLEPADDDRFVSSSRPGTVYSDGRIVVDGQTVATGAMSEGRTIDGDSTYKTVKINGTTYYYDTVGHRFASGVKSLPVTVLFNSKGVEQFAVMNACGNPVFGSPSTPSYSCKALNMTAVSGKANTYQYTTSASAGNNASITKVVYDFGDGTSATETNPSTAVTHTYTKGGTFTAKVTVYVHLPGNQQATVTSTTCAKTVTITLPYYECVQLGGAILDKAKMSYSFVATAKYGGGATFTGADFNFGDGNTQEDVKPASGSNSVTVTHTYAVANTYNANAVLHFTVAGKDVTAAACPAMVTPTTPPTPECKPGVPVGDSECDQCPTDASLPADSPDCSTPPPALPNTGAGDTIAIFAAVAIGGFLVYRQLLFRKHRAAFTAAERGIMPLPLANPLDVDTPLAGTPLAPNGQAERRRVFHRKRPF